MGDGALPRLDRRHGRRSDAPPTPSDRVVRQRPPTRSRPAGRSARSSASVQPAPTTASWPCATHRRRLYDSAGAGRADLAWLTPDCFQTGAGTPTFVSLALQFACRATPERHAIEHQILDAA